MINEIITFLLLPLQEPYRLIQGCFIFAGLWADMRLLKMVIYEWKNKGGGEKYLRYGSKAISSRNKGIKK